MKIHLMIWTRQLIIKKEGPFDGILGFSQGARVAAYFAYYCEIFPEKIKDWMAPKFTILLASPGFFPREPNKKYTIEIPSIHFIGENDFIFSTSLFTTILFKKPIVFFHKQRHKIPELTERQINIVRIFFNKFGRRDINLNIKAKF